jgi:nucleoid-associated protein EbfC
MGGFLENLKKAQQLLQVEAAKMQEELGRTDIEGFSSDESVRVVFSGNQEPRSIDITQAAIDQGPEKLNALVAEAMKDAHSNSVAEMKSKLGGLAAKMGVPGGGGLPGM